MHTREPAVAYTFKEEVFNASSHWAGVILGIIGLVVMLHFGIMKGSVLAICAFAIYGGCFIAMYGCSALYHSIPVGKVKAVLRVFDHASIFVFIAGTYTPVILLSLHGTLRILMLVAVWGIALFGVIFKIATFGQFGRFNKLSLVLYLGLGWLSVFLLPEIFRQSTALLLYLFAGGVLYSIGTYFYSRSKIPYAHGVWHLFVLGASLCHFAGIFRTYVL